MVITFRTTETSAPRYRPRGGVGAGSAGCQSVAVTQRDRFVGALAYRFTTGTDQLDAEGQAIIPPKLKPQIDQLEVQFQQLPPDEQEAMLSVMAIVARFESDAKSERMREWHAARDLSGLAHGNRDRLLFCRKRVGGKLLQLPCPDQRAHARLFFGLYRDGNSVARIVGYASDHGMLVPGTRRRYRWHRIAASIAAEHQIRILAREMQIAEDHPCAVHAWAGQTCRLTWNERCRLPKRSAML